MKETKPFKLPEDYPFKEELEKQRQQYKDKEYSVTIERITITERASYSPTNLYAKLFQQREILNCLTPAACRVLITICCLLEYEGVMIELRHESSGLSKNTFYKAIIELIFNKMIKKVEGKKSMYWVNIALVVVGDAQRKQLS